MRKRFLLILGMVCWCAAVASGQSPNVIFIITDDVGTGDFSAYDNLDGLGVSSKISTPNVDWLAAEGMRFTHAHSVASLCAPTRAGTMTGSNLWHANTRWGMGGTVFRSGQIGAGDLMQNAGYRTAFLGKMHLGGTFYDKNSPGQTTGHNWSNVNAIDFDTPIRDGLQEHGFDYSLGLNAGIQGGPYFFFENGRPVQMDTSGNSTAITNATYATQVRQWSGGTYNGGETVIQSGGWGSTDFNTMHVPQQMAQNAVDFMADNVSNHSADPFFMYYATVGVHTPHVPDMQLEVDLNGDGDALDAGEITAIDGYDGSGPAPDDLGTDRMGMVSTIDAELGVLRAYLEATDDPRNPGHKLIDNTMIIFTSDNGGHGWGVSESEPDDWTIYEHDGSSGLRDRKGSIYEGGHRVPFIVKWEGHVEEGAVRDQLIGTHDVMATLAGLTDQSLTDQAKDSFNMMPVLVGAQDDSDPVRDHMIIEHISGQGNPRGNAYYEGRWKLMVNRTNTTSPAILGFYDLSTDPAEATDLSTSTDPAVVERRNAMYANYLERRNAARSAPVFISSGDAADTAVLAAYTHVITEGHVSGDGLIHGDLQANSGSVIEVTATGGATTQYVTINPTQDVYIKAGDPDTNFNAQRLALGTTNMGVGRVLLDFDLTDAVIPAGGTIEGVELILTVGFSQGSGPQDHTVGLHRLDAAFVDSEATWNLASAGAAWSTAGGDFSALLDSIAGIDLSSLGSGDTLIFSGATFEADVLANLSQTSYRLLMKTDDVNEASGVLGSAWSNSMNLGSPVPQLVFEVNTPADRQMDVAGDFYGRDGSVLDVELGGLDHDVLAVTGDAVLLGGGLDVGLDVGVTPALGESFDVLTSDALTGTFDHAQVNIAPLADVGGKEVALAVLYVDNGTDGNADLDNVRVMTTYRGDANGDGNVNPTDLAALTLNWLGTDAMWQGGDFNYDGVVNPTDLAALTLNWLESIPTAPATVPEPTSLALLALGGVALVCRRCA